MSTDPANITGPAVPAVVALSATEIGTLMGDGQAERLRALLPEAVWFDTAAGTRADWEKLLGQVRPRIAVTGWRTPPIPPTATGLVYVAHVVGSVRFIVPRSLLAAGLAVTNWGGVAAPLVAEHALLLTLGALRSMPQWQSFLATPFSHEDKDRLDTRSLYRRRVSIHGFGHVARQLIRLLRPFEVTISAYSAGVPEDWIRSHDVRPVTSLEALAEDADVLITCEALTDRSRGAIGRGVLSKLARGATFVNVGRGAIVDEAALAAVAAERGLRVASDVFAQEPLPLDSPLRCVPHALYSPHMAGPTLDWYPACGRAAVANVERFLAGQPLVDVVSLDLYDRST